MIKKEIDEFNIKNLKERFAVQKIKNFRGGFFRFYMLQC